VSGKAKDKLLSLKQVICFYPAEGIWAISAVSVYGDNTYEKGT